MNSIVACCHSAKLCAHAARAFRWQQNGAVTRMWRSCRVNTQKERAIGAVRCKKEGMLLQPLHWCCVECVIHHERDVRENNTDIYVARTSNNRVIVARELYCCLLPQCEALRTCRSGFLIATQVTRGGSCRRAAGLQPSLKNLRQKIPPNGQTRLKFGFSYENFTTQSFSVLPTPFWLNVS